MNTPRRPRNGLLVLAAVLAAVLALALVAVGIAYRTATERGEDTDARAEGPVEEELRIMLAGDSMTQGANGDRTWRYHLWNHLASRVEGLEFVGPYSDPASRSMILPVPTAEDEDPQVLDGGSGEGDEEGGSDSVLDETDTATPGEGSEEPSEPDAPDGAAWPGLDGDPDTAEYRDPDFDQDHNALWGRTLRDAATSIQEEVRVHRPDVLCVMLGVNDLLWPVDKEEMEYRLRGYVEAARGGNPHLRILLAEAPPIALAEADEGFALRVYVYNMLVREVAADMSTEESPVTSLDIAGAEDWTASVDTYDGTHPNADGEVKIAAAFADALAEEYGIGAPYPRSPSPSPEDPEERDGG